MYFIENTLSRNASRCFTFSARDREIVHRRLKVIRLVLLFLYDVETATETWLNLSVNVDWESKVL